jgi:hypothetical protein
LIRRNWYREANKWWTNNDYGVLINRIARLNSDGSVDAGFNVGTGFNDYTTGLAYNIDNTKLYIGGNFTQFNGTSK